MSAVHAAAQAGQLSCLKWLVDEAGVSIRHRSEDGATPAHFAAASGEVECLEWILSHGGSVLDRDSLGGTLVHDAAEQGQVKTLLHLMKKGVDMNSKDDDGLTPLDIANENRNEECIRLLFKAKKTDILTSLTPKQSLSRASASVEDEQRAAQMRQKQREFEQILLSGVSNEQREAMWQIAQEKATVVQPGLKLLLEGENGASPSAFSLQGAARITPVGSMRRRQKSSKQDEFVPTDMSTFKPRPSLTAELFDAPMDRKPKQDTSVTKEQPKRSLSTTTSPQQSKVELKNKPKGKQQSLPPSKKAEFRQSGSGESPVPKRAKFVKKFSTPKLVPHDKKKATKTSKSKLPAESGKMKVKPKKSVVSLNAEQKVPTKQRKVSSEQKPRQRKVSKTKEKQVQATEQMKKKSHKKETSSKTVADLETRNLHLEPLTQKEESKPDAPQLQPSDNPPNGFNVVADALAEKVIKEAVAMQGTSTTHGNTGASPYEEEVNIEKNKQRESLLTPDETVTVTFKGASKAEQPSLFNDQKTATENDLASPEGSDDEEGGPKLRDSFVTPGFENLDYRNFERFGENVEDFESQLLEQDKEWMAGRRTSMRNSGVINVPSSEKAQREDGLPKKLNFEDNLEQEEETPMGSTKEERDALLSRWEKRHSLNRIDQLPSEERKRISETYDDDDLVNETISTASLVSVESLHIRHLNAKAVYMKMQDFERQRQERGYTQVLQIRDRLQMHDDDENSDVGLSGKITKKRPSSIVKVGNVSAKLEMFGGGADYAKKQTELHQERDKTGEHPGSPIKTSLFTDEFTFDSLPSSPEKGETAFAETKEAPKEEVDGPTTDRSPSHGKVKGRSSLSSRASATTFETIREAEEDNGEVNTSHDQVINQKSVNQVTEDEMAEKVSPLPKLPPNLSRRLSQEKLRLDGLLASEGEKNVPPPQVDEQSQAPYSKMIKASSVPKSADARQQLFVSFHESSLNKSVESPVERKKKGRAQSRPVSAPPFHQKVEHLERDYMAKEILKAESKVTALLSAPQLTGSTLQLDLNRGSLKTWKQEAGYIVPVKSATFHEKDVYIFHFADWYGPLLHHVYQWVGSKAGDSLVHSAYEHCQTLAKCLPGRPVMHREYQGYESFSFLMALGPGARLLRKYKAAVPYLNSFLTKAMLYTFHESLSSFETIEDSSGISAKTLKTHRVAVILDTPLCVFVWLPKRCWEDKKHKNAFSIAELFVAHCSYPEWTPVTVVIQDGEVWEFYSHFSSWPFVDLRLSEKASALYLPVQKEPKFHTTMENSQIKVWQMVNQEVKELAPEELDNFGSSHIYLVQHTEHKHTSLYSWTEGTVYIWVGAEVDQRKEAVLTATHKARSLGITSKTPIVIVPENLEPPQLLNLFSGNRGHDHYTSPNTEYPTHTLPMMFVCEVNRGVVSFTQLQRPVAKKSLKPEKCYLLTYKTMLFIRQDKRWKTSMHPSDVAANFISQFHSWKNESDFVISLLTEGNEGETFWKWFDMQNASIQVQETASRSIPKRPVTSEKVGELLVKAREIIASEIPDVEESEEKDRVPMREPSATHPILLTESQEATFESVEKLKEQLEDLVEDGQEEMNKRSQKEEETTSKGKQMSPIRVSQAIQELSDITSGLNELLQASAPARAEDDEAAASKFATISDSPPIESSVTTERNILQPSAKAPVEGTNIEEATPGPQVKSKRIAPSTETPTLSVTVEVAEGPSKGVYEIKVKEKSPVIVVIFKVARVSGFALRTTSAIFEVCEALSIQCPLEDHELIKDIIARWPSKNPPKLVLKDFASKNILWSISPPIHKEVIRKFAKEGMVPELSSDLLYSSKQGHSKKMKWKQSCHCLKGVGIYSIGDPKKGSKLELSTSLDHRLYTPIITSIKDSEIPNKYCFVMKPPLSWKDKDLKFYCAGDFMAMARWVHGIRLIKHGLQLKGNFTAMRTRIKKIKSETQQSTT